MVRSDEQRATNAAASMSVPPVPGTARSLLAARTVPPVSRFARYRVLVMNAGSLVGTAAVTSVFGFAYWWIAARGFSPEVVGAGSASVAAMQVLGTVATFGFGTLLIGELPRRVGDTASLIVNALYVVGSVGAALGTLFVLLAPQYAATFAPLATQVGAAPLMAVGVALTALALTLDGALFGLLRGDLQFARNTVFAVTKLGALALVARWGMDIGLPIHATWVFGGGVSLVALGGYATVQHGGRWNRLRPRPSLVRAFGGAASRHHALNLTLQLPPLALPLVAAAILPAAAVGYFAVAWLVAGFAFIGPYALTLMLPASGAADATATGQTLRFTLRLATLVGIAANVALFVGAGPLLSVFGAEYAAQAAWPLRVIGLGVFPLIAKDHYVAVARMTGGTGRAAGWLLAGGTLELVGAAVGAWAGGLTGLGIGWVLAVCVQAAGAIPTVIRAARRNATGGSGHPPPIEGRPGHLAERG